MNVLERDFFTDRELLQDPTPYYAALRQHGPIWREPHQGVFILSGIEEILELYADQESFSAIVGGLGPLVKLPEPGEGESWAEMIERRRHEIPLGDQLIALDPPRHTRQRALVGKIFTPNRLKLEVGSSTSALRPQGPLLGRKKTSTPEAQRGRQSPWAATPL